MRTHLRLPALAAALIMLSVSGCGTDQTSSKPSTPAEPNEAVETNPASETAKGPAAETSSESGDTARIVEGRATWYGPGLYGNKTASGDVLQEGTMTAAHSSLPLGTEVKVTRLDTDESVMVVINDRKPFKEGTVIDLAHGAADQLEIDEDGEAVVRLEVLD